MCGFHLFSLKWRLKEANFCYCKCMSCSHYVLFTFNFCPPFYLHPSQLNPKASVLLTLYHTIFIRSHTHARTRIYEPHITTKIGQHWINSITIWSKSISMSISEALRKKENTATRSTLYRIWFWSVHSKDVSLKYFGSFKQLKSALLLRWTRQIRNSLHCVAFTFHFTMQKTTTTTTKQTE